MKKKHIWIIESRYKYGVDKYRPSGNLHYVKRDAIRFMKRFKSEWPDYEFRVAKYVREE